MVGYTLQILKRINKKCGVCGKPIFCKPGEENAKIYHVECLKKEIQNVHKSISGRN